MPGEAVQVLLTEVPTSDVGAERKRQAGVEEPPLTEVDDLVQPVIAVRELSFVDQQPCVRAAGDNLVDDLVEGHFPEAEVMAEGQAKNEKRRRHATRNRDLDIGQLATLDRTAGNKDRPVTRPHARPVWEEDVAVLDERVRVK